MQNQMEMNKNIKSKTPMLDSFSRDITKIALENKDYETAKECFDLIIEKTNYPRDKFNAINNNLKIAIETKPKLQGSVIVWE